MSSGPSWARRLGLSNERLGEVWIRVKHTALVSTSRPLVRSANIGYIRLDASWASIATSNGFESLGAGKSIASASARRRERHEVIQSRTTCPEELGCRRDREGAAPDRGGGDRRHRAPLPPRGPHLRRPGPASRGRPNSSPWQEALRPSLWALPNRPSLAKIGPLGNHRDVDLEAGRPFEAAAGRARSQRVGDDEAVLQLTRLPECLLQCVAVHLAEIVRVDAIRLGSEAAEPELVPQA
jgi:hypothetical protein